MTSDNPAVKLVRLKTGDDVICEVVTIEMNEEIWYTLVHPLKVSYVPSDHGYLQIAFLPWVFPKICDVQEFTINDGDVLFMADVSEKMNRYYWENLDTYIKESREPEQPVIEEEPEEQDLSVEDELEIYKKIMEHLGNKRTFH